MFTKFIETFETEEFKKIATDMLEIIPDYFYKVPASSSGKYHSPQELGEGGLYRHTLRACCVLNNLFEAQEVFTPQVRDCMRIAIMYHDTFKSGTQSDYEADNRTRFEHPIIAAEKVENWLCEHKVQWTYTEFVTSCIRSHMNRWNTSTYSSTTLPLPSSTPERLVALADYIGSRKYITFDLEEAYGD